MFHFSFGMISTFKWHHESQPLTVVAIAITWDGLHKSTTLKSIRSLCIMEPYFKIPTCIIYNYVVFFYYSRKEGGRHSTLPLNETNLNCYLE